MVGKTKPRKTRRLQRRKKLRRTGKKTQKGGTSPRSLRGTPRGTPRGNASRSGVQGTPRRTPRATPLAIKVTHHNRNFTPAEGMLSVTHSPSGSISVTRTKSAPAIQPSQTAQAYWVALTERGRAIQQQIGELTDHHAEENLNHEALAQQHMSDYEKHSSLAQEHLDLANDYRKQYSDIDKLIGTKGKKQRPHIRFPTNFAQVIRDVQNIRAERVQGVRNPRYAHGTRGRRGQQQRFLETASAEDFVEGLIEEALAVEEALEVEEALAVQGGE